MVLEDIARVNTTCISDHQEINIFENTDAYKCIQFYLNGEAYLRIGLGYHRNILIGFLEECNQAGLDVASQEYIDELKAMNPRSLHHYQKQDVLFRTDKYKIAGAGTVSVIPKGYVKFSSNSIFLEIGINKAHVNKVKEFLPEGNSELVQITEY